MSRIVLDNYQLDAIRKMKLGCILNGNMGSGKSRTGLAFYYLRFGGKLGNVSRMTNAKDLYIITTAHKRDTMEWESEMASFRLYTDGSNIHGNKVVVDSWNNIQKYVDVKGAFFLFDEQKVVGYGLWSKSFIEISRKNEWILLSATPGDCWMDYIPVFIANGFYRNKTDFVKQHVVYSNFTKFPRVEKYLNVGKLMKLRNSILIPMDYVNPAERHNITVNVGYDIDTYDFIERKRFDPFKNEPIRNASQYCFCLRKVVNSSLDRIQALLCILEKHKKVIVFYSYDYELELLREQLRGYPYAEWNGNKHEKIPPGDAWVYLVEYFAGSEGWNCTTTDTIVFYSQSYSYKMMLQASGRIDRRNTPYKDLYYYHLKSSAKIDIAIQRTVKRKKKFNEKGFAPSFEKE